MELQNRPDLQLLAKYTSQTPQHATIVEIGTHLGDTALVMAKATPSATIYTIDTGERWLWERPDLYRQLDNYRDFLQMRFENHNIIFRIGSSHYKEGEYIVPWGMGEIDLLFIDGDHNYDAVMSDLLRWAPMVKANGYMLLHDDVVGDTDKVYGALRDYLRVHKEWRILEAESTMTACQKRKDDTFNDPT